MKWKLEFTDYLVIFAAVLMIATHFITTLIVAHMTPPTFTAEQADMVIEIFEFAPLAKWALRTEQLAAIGDLILTPAIIIGTYMFVRRRSDAAGREGVAVSFFFVAIVNFLNDAAILMGSLAVL